MLVCGKSWSQDSASPHPLSPGAVFRFTALCEALDTQPWRSCEIPSRELVSSRSLDDPTMTRLQHAACAACRGRPESVLPLDSSADETGDASRTTQAEADARRPGFGKAAGKANFAERAAGPGLLAGVAPLHRVVGAREKGESQRLSRCGWPGGACCCCRRRRARRRRQQQQISPYFNPTYTRTGWIGQPPVLDRHEVVTIDGDVVTLRQATP